MTWRWPFSKRNWNLLPDYGVRYLQHVLAEYTSLPPEKLANVPPDVKAIKHQAEVSSPPGEGMTWGDLFVLEKAILGIQTDATVRRRVWVIRGAFRELFGQKSYQDYMTSKPPDENTAAIDDVRADLDRLLDSLHWSYALIPIRERIRSKIIRVVGLWVLSSVIVLLLLAWWSSWCDETLVAALLVLMVAGAVGGFTSLVQRIQTMPEGDPLISIFELRNGTSSIYLAPISGAIFAVVLYLIFLGKLLGGTIFPKDVTPFSLNWGHLARWQSPVMAADDFGKLVVWAFIAGFAERFVPDTLDRLVNRAQQAAGPAQAVPAPGSPPTSPP